MKSAVALLMIGVALMYSGKPSLQYFKETSGLKVLTALMAPYHIFDFGVQVWEDQTGTTDAFRQEGYDGEDSLSLDLKEKELKELEEKEMKELKELEEKELEEKEMKELKELEEKELEEKEMKELEEKELEEKEMKELKELEEKELEEKEMKELKELEEKELEEKEMKELRENEVLYFSPVCSPSRRRA
ncbi:DNA ligase 1 isoform X1 [Ctenopharyngodon idella]|uniref:DNA ligase 1 isoform X1 n=1 Tax=Ctenopharyngodon idella TaxID=7959 RepID=UPI0022310DC4|nr:DNA ligase 1 isoform X1 [Ctenopharyngodon idella]